jgi:hypothetical protein
MKKPTKAQLKAAKAAVDLEEVIVAERQRRLNAQEQRAAHKRQAEREALTAKSRVVSQQAGRVVAARAKSLAGEFAFVLVGLAIVVLIGILVTLTPIPGLGASLWSSAINFLNTLIPWFGSQALCFHAQAPQRFSDSCVPVSWSAVVLFFSLIVAVNFAVDYGPKLIDRLKEQLRRQ